MPTGTAIPFDIPARGRARDIPPMEKDDHPHRHPLHVRIAG
eukprot:COSAG02_NODE_6248_length_3700_cov_3.058039_3_plen_41_part_00